MKMIVFEKNEIHPNALLLLEKNGIEFIAEDPLDKTSINAIFVRTYTKVTAEFLQSFPNLKYILRCGVGLDNIDLEECKRKGIKVFNSPGSNANAVSELVICFMLMMLRQVQQQMQSLQNGNWRQKEFFGEELTGKVIGIIGCGAIGKLVAKKLQEFGVKEIVGYDPFLTKEALQEHGIQKVELIDALKTADVITLHLPLLPETKNLINKANIALMKDGSYLINTSRGGIINEEDLIVALQNGKLKGAALDVYENEPSVNPKLLTLTNLIPTPHIAAFTTQADEAMSVQVAERFLKAIQK